MKWKQILLTVNDFINGEQLSLMENDLINGKNFHKR